MLSGVCSGNIMVHDEVTRFHVLPCWESVTPSAVKTSREVFQELSDAGYQITYSRVPVTPESVFDAKDIVSPQAASAAHRLTSTTQDHLVRVFLYSLRSSLEGTDAATSGNDMHIMAMTFVRCSDILLPNGRWTIHTRDNYHAATVHAVRVNTR